MSNVSSAYCVNLNGTLIIVLTHALLIERASLFYTYMTIIPQTAVAFGIINITNYFNKV